MSFNTTAYDAASSNYNIESPLYIDGTTPSIPINGTNYYNSYFGNVMCAFAVDGGDSLLGGNAIVSGTLSVGGALRVGTNTISSTTAGYLGSISSNVQTQLNNYSTNAHVWSGGNFFSGNVALGPNADVYFPTTISTTTLVGCTATNDPIQLIDLSNNVVSVANALPNTSYQICTLKNSTSMYYYLVTHTPGVVGAYLNAYDAFANTTQYATTNTTVNGVSYVAWGCPFTLNNNTITMYMYGLDNSRIPYLPATQYAKVVIANTNSTLTSTTFSYLRGASSNLQTQINNIGLPTTGASGNYAIGASTLLSLAADSYGNSAFGMWALKTATGQYNTGIGAYAGNSGSLVSCNTCVGVGALSPSIGAVDSNNTAVGFNALGMTLGLSLRNTAIGDYAGAYAIGNYNTFVGASSGQPSTDSTAYSYSSAIGYNAVTTASHQIILGSSGEYVRCAGTGAATGANTGALRVVGGACVGGNLYAGALCDTTAGTAFPWFALAGVAASYAKTVSANGLYLVSFSGTTPTAANTGCWYASVISAGGSALSSVIVGASVSATISGATITITSTAGGNIRIHRLALY